MIVTELAPAKINLALHVRARRPDGYHEIETLFAFCRDGDELTFETADHDSFRITGPFVESLAGGPNNLVVAAREAFERRVAPLPCLAITLDKRLPVASGIGGGSADAAAALRAFAYLSVVPEDAESVVAIARDLGSDVPACLFGRTAFGTGRGDVLVTAQPMTDTPLLLVNPRVPVSTTVVFAGWDGIDRGPLTDFATGRNDLESSAIAATPIIGEVLALLRKQPDVTLARMSGSGATCFALFDNEAARSAARNAIAAAYPDWWYLESTLA